MEYMRLYFGTSMQTEVEEQWVSETKTARLGIGKGRLPPLKWKLARVVELHPGSDIVTRVVTIKFSDGSRVKRPIAKLCIVLCSLLACVSGAVLPKPPAAAQQKSDSPAVNELPLRPESKQPAGEIHKPLEKLEKAKSADASKPEQKSTQKEKPAAQKPEEQARRRSDTVKQEKRENQKQNMHSKSKPVEEKKPAENTKEPLKAAEETKAKPAEKGR
ncbi:hypothetical protein YQE_00832, partial [Dendroctonus ponderosae]